MYRNYIIIVLFCILNIFNAKSEPGSDEPGYVLVIHGGAGSISKERIDEESRKQYTERLTDALKAGEEILKTGGSSVDAVEAAVRILEDSPLFNAGKGSVFTIEGNNELDASLMCGNTLNSGAVASVTSVKNPVSAARKVMEESPHVMLIGKGAENFAYEQGLEIVEPSYFYDQKRWNDYREYLRRSRSRDTGLKSSEIDLTLGTVGAVALDMDGNLAAATSTGGMTGKQYGRIGDSPIIGAGTYANNKTCAVSATGHGEYFIRNVVAHDISARMQYKGASLGEAANYIINSKLKELNASGGVIAVDRQGNIAMPFNTKGMFRGFINSKGISEVKIFSDD